MNKEITLDLPVDQHLIVLLSIRSYKEAVLSEIHYRLHGNIQQALEMASYRRELERWWSGSVNTLFYSLAGALMDIYMLSNPDLICYPIINRENSHLQSSEKAVVLRNSMEEQHLYDFLTYAWSLMDKYRELKFKMMYSTEDPHYYSVVLVSPDDYKSLSEDQLMEWNIIGGNNNDNKGDT